MSLMHPFTLAPFTTGGCCRGRPGLRRSSGLQFCTNVRCRPCNTHVKEWCQLLLEPVRPERRPQAEVEGYASDGLSALGGASTPPAARTTLSKNGWGAQVALSKHYSSPMPFRPLHDIFQLTNCRTRRHRPSCRHRRSSRTNQMNRPMSHPTIHRYGTYWPGCCRVGPTTAASAPATAAKP
jgi:hypothetical protein